MSKKKIELALSNISGEMRVFANTVGKGKNAFTKYSTSISKKDGDEYINYYIDLAFKKGNTPDFDEGNKVIQVNSAFFTVNQYEDKNGDTQKKPVLFIMDYDEE